MRSKKFVIVYAVALFLIIFLITFNSICAITQFDVRYETGSPLMAETAEKIQDELEEKYLKKNFLFFKQSDVNDLIAKEGKGYLEVMSVEKHFPNKITVSLREKFEGFAFEQGGKYTIVAEDGTVLAYGAASGDNSGRNVEIAGFAFDERKVGEVFAVKDRQKPAYEAFCVLYEKMNQYFDGIRNNVTRIEYFVQEMSTQEDIERFVISMTEGVQIIISAPRVNIEEKTEAALNEYDLLSVLKKTYGYIRVTDLQSGGVNVAYFEKLPPEDLVS